MKQLKRVKLESSQLFSMYADKKIFQKNRINKGRNLSKIKYKL